MKFDSKELENRPAVDVFPKKPTPFQEETAGQG